MPRYWYVNLAGHSLPWHQESKGKMMPASDSYLALEASAWQVGYIVQLSFCSLHGSVHQLQGFLNLFLALQLRSRWVHYRGVNDWILDVVLL